MSGLINIPVDELKRRRDVRPLNDEAVASLAESISTIGLVNPIRVRRAADGFEIIAGSHRFAACDSLGWGEITCIVVDDDDLHAELAMIDENLCRAELSPADRAKQTARRKAIYLELHPETAVGENQHTRVRQVGEGSEPAMRFTAETAKITGASERVIQRHAERGEKVIPEAIDLVQGTKLDTGVYLDKLKRLSPNEQVHAVKRDLAIERQRYEQPRPGGIAARIAPADPELPRPVTFDELRAALETLGRLSPDEYSRLCPPNKRAAMCQRLSALIDVFEQVKEAVTA